MAAGELDVVDLRFTFSTGFTTRILLTRMITWLVTALARFFALESGVHGFGVTLGSTTMAAIESVNACFIASSLGADFGKVVRFVYIHNLVGVSWTA
jgi:hypothetical protein